MTDQPDNLVENELDRALLTALEGGRKGRERFLGLFLVATVYVPERFQTAPLMNPAPPYPDPFFNLLAFSVEDRALIPVFSTAAHLEEWATRPLTFRELPVTKLLELCPKDWWLIVNPGLEIEKEFSPWEVDLLRGGAANISVLIRELAADEEVTNSLEVRELPEAELPEVRMALLSYANDEPAVRSIRVALERVQTVEGTEDNRLVVLLRVKESDPALSRVMEEAVRDLIALKLIGSYAVSVTVAPDVQSSLLVKPYEHIAPMFDRPGLVERVRAGVSKLLGKE